MTTTPTPASQPSPARSDMPQECEDCGRSMTRCACCPARSDKDAERKTIGQMFEHVGGHWTGSDKLCPTFGSAEALRIYTVKMQRQAVESAAKAQESAPSSNKDAERANLALPIQVRNWDGEDCLFDAKDKPLWVDLPKEEYRSGIMEMVRIVNASAICTCPSGDGSLRWPCPKHPVDQGTQAESAPSSERCAECGLGCAPGVCIYGAANEITDVLGLFARRATAGTTAAPSGEPDTETLQFLTDVVTAAGLLEHGRTCKALAKRIADAAYKMRESLFATHEMGVDAVRRAFEAYVARSGEFTDWTRLKDGYARPRVQFAWNTWLAALARRATAGPSSEVSFDAFWSDEVARNGGHGFGADYKHWARKGFDAARRATAAPSGESIDISKLTRWTFDGGMSAEARKDGQWVSFSDLEVLARRATAGTTAAPSAWPVQVPEGVYYSAEHDNFYSVDNKGVGQGFYERWAERKDQFPVATLERATAGNAAPTEAPAKQLRHRITSWSGKEITSADLVVSLNTYGKCMPGAGRAQWAMREAAAYIAAGNTATAAPGDLPPLPGVVGEGRAETKVVISKGDLTLMLEKYGRACIASNAGDAPGWQTVPKEPTEAMVHAAEDLPAPRMFAKVYRAMLAAAPSNPPVGAHERKEP